MRPFDLFSTFNMDRQTDQQAYIPKKMQFYISAMFLSFPDEIHKEKPSFLDFENNWSPTDGPTDRPTDRRTDRPSYRDARTHLKIATCKSRSQEFGSVIYEGTCYAFHSYPTSLFLNEKKRP